MHVQCNNGVFWIPGQWPTALSHFGIDGSRQPMPSMRPLMCGDSLQQAPGQPTWAGHPWDGLQQARRPANMGWPPGGRSAASAWSANACWQGCRAVPAIMCWQPRCAVPVQQVLAMGPCRASRHGLATPLRCASHHGLATPPCRASHQVLATPPRCASHQCAGNHATPCQPSCAGSFAVQCLPTWLDDRAVPLSPAGAGDGAVPFSPAWIGNAANAGSQGAAANLTASATEDLNLASRGGTSRDVRSAVPGQPTWAGHPFLGRPSSPAMPGHPVARVRVNPPPGWRPGVPQSVPQVRPPQRPPGVWEQAPPRRAESVVPESSVWTNADDEEDESEESVDYSSMGLGVVWDSMFQDPFAENNDLDAALEPC